MAKSLVWLGLVAIMLASRAQAVPTYTPWPTPSPTYSPLPFPTFSPVPSPSYSPVPLPSYSPAPTPPIATPVTLPCKYRVGDKLSFRDEEGIQYTIGVGAGEGPNTGPVPTDDDKKYWNLKITGDEATLWFTSWKRKESLDTLLIKCSAELKERTTQRVYKWIERLDGTCGWKQTLDYQTTNREYTADRKMDATSAMFVTVNGKNFFDTSSPEGSRMTNDENYQYQAVLVALPRQGVLVTLDPYTASSTALRRGDGPMPYEKTAELDKSIDLCRYSFSEWGFPTAEDQGQCSTVLDLQRTTLKTINEARDGAESVAAGEGFSCSNSWLVDFLRAPQ